jgi:NifU-like protein involved in Fe-S cluster formation
MLVRHMGEFRTPDGLGRAAIPCGDSMQIGLRVVDGRILEARFMADGCGPVVACGSMVTDLVQGKTISAAMALDEGDIIAGLDGLPEAETHCATLAVTALRRAILDHLALQREPWKKPYRQAGPFEPGWRA